MSAIDRGDADVAHAELRKFDSVSIETYEGGAFLRWLRDPVERLSDYVKIDPGIDPGIESVTDEHYERTPAQDGG